MTQRMTARPADHTLSVSAGLSTPSPGPTSDVTIRVPLVLGGLCFAMFLGILVAVVNGSADTIDLTFTMRRSPSAHRPLP